MHTSHNNPRNRENSLFVFLSDSSEDKQSKPKAKDGTKTENESPGTAGTSRQERMCNFFISLLNCSNLPHASVNSWFLPHSRPPKKNFVEVTELTDITYMSNLVKLRPGHMNIVLVLTDASKNILLSKFAKEVYSFTG